MRTPGKPRKPTPLSHGRIDERSGGGESVAPQLPDYTQDYVPTAAVDPIDVADYAQDDLAQIDHDYSFSEEPIELSERYLERRAERRRIRFKRFFYVGTAFAGTLLCGWLLFFSPVMAYTFDDGDIRGLPQASIVDRSRLADVLRGHDGEQILLFDDERLQAQVKEAIPEVAQISSSYHFPNSLVFEVVEQVPVACIVLADQCQAIAQDGTRITVPSERLGELIKIGELPKALDQETAMSDMTSVLDSLSNDVRALVDQISIDENMLISLSLSDSRHVLWGQAKDNDQKAGILGVLVKQPVHMIDISAPNAPVTS